MTEIKELQEFCKTKKVKKLLLGNARTPYMNHAYVIADYMDPSGPSFHLKNFMRDLPDLTFKSKRYFDRFVLFGNRAMEEFYKSEFEKLGRTKN